MRGLETKVVVALALKAAQAQGPSCILGIPTVVDSAVR